MNTVADRMRFLREHWELSAQTLSLSLGLSKSSWGVYESGSSYPGAQVLTLLAEKDVDINWLLTGVGGPWRKLDEDLKGVLQQAESAEHRNLGLWELMMKASRSNIAVRHQICEALNRVPMKLADILNVVNKPKQDVVLGLMELLKQKRIEAYVDGGVEKYRLCGDVIENNPVSDAECAAVVLDSIKFLATDLRSGLETSPDSSIILNATINTDDAKAIVANLRSALFSIAKQASTGSQSLKVIVAAKIG